MALRIYTIGGIHHRRVVIKIRTKIKIEIKIKIKGKVLIEIIMKYNYARVKEEFVLK